MGYIGLKGSDNSDRRPEVKFYGVAWLDRSKKPGNQVECKQCDTFNSARNFLRGILEVSVSAIYFDIDASHNGLVHVARGTHASYATLLNQTVPGQWKVGKVITLLPLGKDPYKIPENPSVVNKKQQDVVVPFRHPDSTKQTASG